MGREDSNVAGETYKAASSPRISSSAESQQANLDQLSGFPCLAQDSSQIVRMKASFNLLLALGGLTNVIAAPMPVEAPAVEGRAG